jgi:hypothetical protein
MKTCIKCGVEKDEGEFYKGRNQCKACRCAVVSAYRAANPEKVKAYQKAWAAANPEKVKASQRAWRAANPEKVKASKKAWRAANPDKVRAQKKAWAAYPEKAGA